MPLVNISFPGNTAKFMSIIAAIANFEILPSDTMLGWFFDFDKSLGFYNVRFNQMGYSSVNFFINSGTMIFIFFCILI